MRKNRVIAVLLLALLLMNPVVASTNQQRILSLDSDVYQAIEMLYISQGLALPSTTGPYSEAELALMLEKIDRGALKQKFLPVYEYVVKNLALEPKIQGKGIGLSWNFDANIEGYFHTDTTNFKGRENWIRGFKDQKPLLGIGLETWPGKNFYGYSEFTLGNANTMENGFGTTMFGANIPMIPPGKMEDLDFNMPYRAFVATGGNYWSFQLGRDRLNWGAGTSGNLTLSDTFKYHNMARFTTFSDRFKYTFLLSSFPHPLNYMDKVVKEVIEFDIEVTIPDPKDPDNKTITITVPVKEPVYYNNQNDGPIKGAGQGSLQNGLYFFMSHRLEGRLFKDKVNIALTESMMYQSEDNHFDLRFLNPAAIFHNYYIRSNSNSILSLEIDYTPIRGLNLYAQGIVDEFSMPGEPRADATTKAYPEAFGVLAGIKGVLPVGKLMGHASLEFAHTDPYLYIRYAHENDPTPGNFDEYGLNYVGTIREFTNKVGTLYNPQFLGYTHGNDAIVVNFNAGVKEFGTWSVDANFFYMIHGTFDMFTVYSGVGGDRQPIVSTPTTDGNDALGNYHDSNYKNRNAASHTIVAGVKGAYQITNWLGAFGQIDYINITNFGNIAGQKANDVQLSIGVSFSI